MAERLSYVVANQLEISDFRASSAGTSALVGDPMHPYAVSVVESFGADASGFHARQLTPRVASEADLVLAMTKEHRDALLQIAPRQLRRAYTLREAATLVAHYGAKTFGEMPALRPHLPPDVSLDIRDPISHSSAFFDEIGAEIAEQLRPVLKLC